MSELTEQQAKDLYEAKHWEGMTYRERAEFQLLTPRLTMPFGVFQEAVEKTIGRPVWTHEFSSLGIGQIKAEVFEGKPAPTFEEILNLIPADKRIVILTEATK